MSQRLAGLVRRTWTLRVSGSSRCLDCDWDNVRLSPVRAGRLARQHTRDTGHTTRTAHAKVTEYRKAGLWPG